MSSYIYFTLKNKENVCPLISTSRSSVLYEVFSNFAPYESLAPVTIGDLNEVKYRINERINSLKEAIEKEEKMKDFIKEVDASLEEKIRVFFECEEDIGELNEDIREYESALAFVRIMIDILDEAESSKYYFDERYKIDPDNYLFVGIESGFYNEETENGEMV